MGRPDSLRLPIILFCDLKHGKCKYLVVPCLMRLLLTAGQRPSLHIQLNSHNSSDICQVHDITCFRSFFKCHLLIAAFLEITSLKIAKTSQPFSPANFLYFTVCPLNYLLLTCSQSVSCTTLSYTLLCPQCLQRCLIHRLSKISC